MLYPTLNEALETYIRIMEQSGGLVGVLNVDEAYSTLLGHVRYNENNTGAVT